MSTDPAPYNFTLSDNSPIFQYLPYRDGPIATSWNLTYSGNLDSSWAPDTFVGTGISSHRTSLAGASIQLQWVGTAVSLYGDAQVGTYTTEVDGGSPVDGAGATSGLLASFSGLSYGPHTIVLNVVQDALVSFTGGTITVGMGFDGSSVQTRNISAFTNQTPSTVNTTFFNTHGSPWHIYTTYGTTPISYQRAATATYGSNLTFSLSSTSAFAIIGAVDYNHDTFSVKVTPSLGSPSISTLNASSRWIDIDQTEFLYTGMDQNQTYEVEIVNESDQWFDFSRVVLYGTSTSKPPSVSPSASPSSSNTQASSPHKSSLSAGAAAGIAFGVVLILLAILVLIFLWRRRARESHSKPKPVLFPSDEALSPPFTMSENAASPRPFIDRAFSSPTPWAENYGASFTSSSPALQAASWVAQSSTFDSSDLYQPRRTGGIVRQEVDAGPAPDELIPPKYNHAWIAGSEAQPADSSKR